MSMTDAIRAIEHDMYKKAQSREIGGRNGKLIDCSTLEDELAIEADIEADRQALKECFKE